MRHRMVMLRRLGRPMSSNGMGRRYLHWTMNRSGMNRKTILGHVCWRSLIEIGVLYSGWMLLDHCLLVLVRSSGRCMKYLLRGLINNLIILPRTRSEKPWRRHARLHLKERRLSVSRYGILLLISLEQMVLRRMDHELHLRVLLSWALLLGRGCMCMRVLRGRDSGDSSMRLRLHLSLLLMRWWGLSRPILLNLNTHILRWSIWISRR